MIKSNPFLPESMYCVAWPANSLREGRLILMLMRDKPGQGKVTVHPAAANQTVLPAGVNQTNNGAARLSAASKPAYERPIPYLKKGIPL